RDVVRAAHSCPFDGLVEDPGNAGAVTPNGGVDDGGRVAVNLRRYVPATTASIAHERQRMSRAQPLATGARPGPAPSGPAPSGPAPSGPAQLAGQSCRAQPCACLVGDHDLVGRDRPAQMDGGRDTGYRPRTGRPVMRRRD